MSPKGLQRKAPAFVVLFGLQWTVRADGTALRGGSMSFPFAKEILVAGVVVAGGYLFFALAQRVSHSDSVSHFAPETHVPMAQVILYGERHSNAKILDREFDIWKNAYAQGQRHLFVELPFYTAEFLNEWLKENDDSILDFIFHNIRKTPSGSSECKAFYQRIKAECPETHFHGTDIGHQYEITGRTYLEHLAQKGERYSKNYLLAFENIEQGKIYYDKITDPLEADTYREAAMVRNFIRAFEEMRKGSDVKETPLIGFYGFLHTRLREKGPGGAFPNMATQLSGLYGEAVLQTRDLTVSSPLQKEP